MSIDAALALGATCLVLGAPWWTGWRWRRILVVPLLVSGGALSLGLRSDLEARSELDWPLTATLEGDVVSVTRGAGSWRLALGAVRGGAFRLGLPQQIRLVGEPTAERDRGIEARRPGERLRARVALRPNRPLRNPGRALRRVAPGGPIGRLTHPRLHVVVRRAAQPPLATRFAASLQAWRQASARRLQAAGPGGGLLAALSVGERAGLGEELRLAFGRLGLAHLLAISGLHLAMLTSLVYAASRRMLGWCTPLAARTDVRLPALLIALVAAGVYALLAGAGVPVRRAWLMLVLLVGAFASGRPRHGLSAICLAALLLLMADPFLLFSASAQLSFAASAAIVGSLRVKPIRTSRWIQLVEVSSAALAATAPLAAWHLGSYAPLALLTNLMLVPWTATVLLPAAWIAALAATSDASFADLVLGAAERVGALTGFAVERLDAFVPGDVGRPRPATGWFVAAVCLAGLALRSRDWRRRAGLACGVTGVLWFAPAVELSPPAPRVVFFDVGQGDATLVQGRQGAVLVDAGRALPGRFDLGRSVVVPALRALGVSHLDLLAVSHLDVDHRGGVPAVMRAMSVGELWLPRGSRDKLAAAELLEAARRRGVRVVERGAEDPPARFGDLWVESLWPPESARGASGNNASLVLRIRLADSVVLLPGDLEAEAEAGLLGTGAELRADVLKLAHHGSHSSSTPAFLEAVGARVAVASAGCFSRFGMPHQDVVERLRSQGTPVWWTGRDGAIRIRLANGSARPLSVWGTGSRRRCRPPRPPGSPAEGA